MERASSAVETAKYFIGRQPILNRNEELVAYELLFRSAGSATAAFDDASQATASVIVNTLTGFGIHQILGEHKGFINLDLELLMDDSLHILPKENMVLELLETVRVTPELVAQCRALKELGYTLALDDHEYSPEFEELYEVVDIVKVDLIQTPLHRLEEMVPRLRRHPLQLLAEKVESRTEFQRCLELGFDLFQGYYFARPSIMEKRRLDDSAATLLKLMRLLNEDAELAEIEQTFKGSAGLTYKLLLLVNSVGMGSRRKIETLRHAITMAGRTQIKRWVQLALFAGSDERGVNNPLVDLVAVRASLMENIAGHHHALRVNRDSGEKAFMTGMLSVLEKVYDIPMEEMVRSLNLSDDVTDALMARSGDYGRLLHVAELIERMELDHVGSHLQEMGVSIEHVMECQRSAFAWHSSMA